MLASISNYQDVIIYYKKNVAGYRKIEKVCFSPSNKSKLLLNREEVDHLNMS